MPAFASPLGSRRLTRWLVFLCNISLGLGHLLGALLAGLIMIRPRKRLLGSCSCQVLESSRFHSFCLTQLPNTENIFYGWVSVSYAESGGVTARRVTRPDWLFFLGRSLTRRSRCGGTRHAVFGCLALSSPPSTPRYKYAEGATWQMLLMGREPWRSGSFS